MSITNAFKYNIVVFFLKKKLNFFKFVFSKQMCDNSQYEKSFSIFSIQRHAERLLTEHLLDMKILKGTIENNLQSRVF